MRIIKRGSGACSGDPASIAFRWQSIEAWVGDLERLKNKLDAVLSNDDAIAIEAHHGSHRARPVAAWGFKLLGAASAIARIDYLNGASNGTGFLIWARDVGIPLDEYVLVTANHVVCDPDLSGATRFLKDGKHPRRMRISFELRHPRIAYTCEVLWQSPIDALDISVLRLSPQPQHHPVYDFEASGLKLAACDPDEWVGLPAGGGRRRQRLFPLHYPSGGHLSMSIEDNEFMGLKSRQNTEFPVFLHYRCPTEPGSSGCPILNENLEVVAVHRAGAETMHDGLRSAVPISRVNEGVSIQSLRLALSKAQIRIRKRSLFRKMWG